MIMFRLPREAEGRRLDILMQNIPTLNVKVSKVTDDEIIASHDDSQEVHINQSFVMAWWYTTRKEMTEETKRKIKEKKAISKSL
jgi:hypothetical protein